MLFSFLLALAPVLGAIAQDNLGSTFQGTKTNELVLAAARGYLDEVKRLLNADAAVNATDQRGLTAWQAAKIYGRKGVADFLTSQGADIRMPMPKPEQVIDGMFREIVQTNAPGVAVLIALNGSIVFEKGYGLASIEDRLPVTPETKFRIGSMTKQFTAAAILKLHEEGKLNLDDKLSRFMPGYPRGDEVTIHHLLTHTSGIRDYTQKPDVLKTATVFIEPKDLIKTFENDRYDFDPGKKWSYNNSGYILLGYIIEKISGKPYGDFLHDNFFGPLGMTNTAFPTASDIIEHEAQGYSHEDGQWKKALNWDMSRVYSAGGLYSTVGDLYRWNEALFNGRVLSEASLKAAFTPVHTADDNTPMFEGYGYGWILQELRGVREISHGGKLHGFSSYLLRIQDEKLTVVVLENAMPSAPGMHNGLAEEIAQLYLADKMEFAPTFVVDQTVSHRVYDAYVGRYADLLSGTLIVSKDAERLFAQFAGHPSFELFPSSETEFFSKSADEQITFVRDDKGAVVKAVHRQWGLVLRDPRLPEPTAASAPDAPSEWRDKSPHTTGFITVNGVRLHYLDWGGKWKTLLFLHGMGDTAHRYDDFAPRFTNQFRVLGLTRRGHGESEIPETGYDTATLVEDIRQFLDALKIQRVVLAGHSFAGDELTRFAVVHPDRVIKLIYFDSAYDHSRVPESLRFKPLHGDGPELFPTKEESESADGALRWTSRLFGEQRGRAIYSMMEGSYSARAEYGKIKAPALAFFAIGYQKDVNSAETLPEPQRNNALEFLKAQRKYQEQEIEHFRKQIPSARVVVLTNADHNVFIDREEDVLREMWTFLSK